MNQGYYGTDQFIRDMEDKTMNVSPELKNYIVKQFQDKKNVLESKQRAIFDKDQQAAQKARKDYAKSREPARKAFEDAIRETVKQWHKEAERLELEIDHIKCYPDECHDGDNMVLVKEYKAPYKSTYAEEAKPFCDEIAKLNKGYERLMIRISLSDGDMDKLCSILKEYGIEL